MTGPRRAGVLLACLGIGGPAGAFLEGPPWEAARAGGCAECHPPAIRGSEALSVAGLPERIEPGATYRIVVRLVAADMGAAGFLMSARRGAAPVGRFTAADGRSATRDGLARSTRPGTALAAPGRAEWALDWEAPEPGSDPSPPVRFEVWANASDDDRSPLGDVIHQRTWEVAVAGAGAGTLAAEDAALVRALRAGGLNIYFRHAATDWSQSDRVTARGDWTSCDPERMRQLSPAGRETARAIGRALRALALPVGPVLASPYCRTMETARLLGLGPVVATTAAMNARVAEHFGGTDALAARARRRLGTAPPPGTNAVLVAHGNVVRLATGEYPGEAGAILFRPGPGGALDVVAALDPEDWRRLSARALPVAEPGVGR